MDRKTVYWVEIEDGGNVRGCVELLELRNSGGEPTIWHLFIYEPTSQKLLRRVRADRVIDQWIDLNEDEAS